MGKMRNKLNIDVSTDENKKNILSLFKEFKNKSEIYKFFNVKDTPYNINYINQIASKINFDFSYYKEKKKKYCLQCGKELKNGQKKFCSSSCSAKYNNRGRKHSEETKQKISKSLSKKELVKERYCLQCGKELKNGQKKFCSNNCYQNYYNNKRLIEWKNNPENYSKEDTPPFIKRYLMEKYNNQCQICGWKKINPVTGNIPLEIHHIDGDCTNNREENLQLLCPNCHSLTDNFGTKNKVSKRYKLKKYKNLITVL